jgi:hypothetical protein
LLAFSQGERRLRKVFAPAQSLSVTRPPSFVPYTARRNRDSFAGSERREVLMATSKKKTLDGRHRDLTGRIDKKHGNTRVGALRKSYGEHFARGRRKDMMLKTLLAETGMESLHAYLRKHHK